MTFIRQMGKVFLSFSSRQQLKSPANIVFAKEQQLSEIHSCNSKKNIFLSTCELDLYNHITKNWIPFSSALINSFLPSSEVHTLLILILSP